MRRISHVIYDMDGLLLDTEPFYTEVTQTIAGRYGRVFDWSVKQHMIGRPALESARYLVQTLDLPLAPEQYLEERERLLRERFPAAEPLPGALELTRHLHAHGVPQAVATSSSTEFFELKTQRHGEWFGLFDQIVTGDDPAVQRGKPAPDIFLAAARRLNAEPAQCLVFEDAPSGLRAARAAGMAVVVVPDFNMDRTVYAEADEILDSLIGFRPEHWGLPPRIQGN
ncbi:MAG: HAD-IA family hydrolase [Candidatus Competibacterales bacterium]|nr:HAD-IA family hydrolase [Candidatus Competibacterales bacterium]